MSEDEEENIEELAKLDKYSKNISSDLKYLFIDYLIFRKVNFIVAPFEADAQLAYMFNKKQIDCVVTEDSDLVAYNCTKIIKGLKFNGQCQYIDLTKRITGAHNEYIRNFVSLSKLTRRRQQGPRVYFLRVRLPV